MECYFMPADIEKLLLDIDKFLLDINEEPISTYTAAQAEADGILVTISEELSREFGFTLPVRFTVGVMDLVALSFAPQNSTGHLCGVEPAEQAQPHLATPEDGETFDDRARPILQALQTAIAENPDDRMCEFQVNIGGADFWLWGCMDGTSGPAIHVITPGEY